MRSYKYEERQIGNYKISIYSDDYAQCPCTDWDMVWSFLWEYDDMDCLSQNCNWFEVYGKYGSNKYSLKDTVCELIDDYVDWGDLINYLVAEKMTHYSLKENDGKWLLEWQNEKRSMSEEILEIDGYEIEDHMIYTREFLESFTIEECVQILNDLGKNIVVREWNSRGYSQGHYVEGIAFCTKERFKRIVSDNTDNWKKEALEYLDGEVKCVGMWMWGDVKGFVLEEKVRYTKHYEDPEREDEDGFEWEEIDSCWGYYEETDELIEEVIEEHNLEEVK